MGTQSAEGKADVSPRGDPVGFVQILDDKTIAIPDRPGNNRLDTLSNILANPNVGLLFIIPGFEDTLRVNGRASLVTDPAILQPMAVDGKVRETGDRHPRRGGLPSLRQGLPPLAPLGPSTFSGPPGDAVAVEDRA